MNTNETPQPQTSISQMTPLPGESVQTSPDLLSFLLAAWTGDRQESQNPNQSESSPSPETVESVKLFLNFCEQYLADNPPVQATATENRVTITLSDSQKVQVGGEATEDMQPGAIVPSDAIQI